MSIPPLLHIWTFGYRYRQAPTANAVIDLRWMPSTANIAELHDLSGLDPTVQEWLSAQLNNKDWLEAMLETFGPQLDHAEQQDSRAVTWAFGSENGHDRSVAVAELAATKVRITGMTVAVDHLDLHHRGGR